MHQVLTPHRLIYLLFVLAFGQVALGGVLPNGLSKREIQRVTEVFGTAGTARLLRSAEPYPSMPGAKLGLEIDIFPSKDVNELGNGNGTLSGINLSPRFYLAKGFFWDIDVIFEFLPAGFASSIGSLGVIIKHTMISEKDDWASIAPYFAYTNISGFEDGFKAKNIELGFNFSRDYVKTKPYLALGALFSFGEVSTQFAAIPTENKATYTTLHVSAGIEIEAYFNWTLQLDFMSLSPMWVVLISKRF